MRDGSLYVAELGEWGGWWKEEGGGRGGGAGTGSKEAGGKFSNGGGSFAGLLHRRNNHVSSPSDGDTQRGGGGGETTTSPHPVMETERGRERNSPFGLYSLGRDGVARQLTHSFLQGPVCVQRDMSQLQEMLF